MPDPPVGAAVPGHDSTAGNDPMKGVRGSRKMTSQFPAVVPITLRVMSLATRRNRRSGFITRSVMSTFRKPFFGRA
jgi:hypothetical protein